MSGTPIRRPAGAQGRGQRQPEVENQAVAAEGQVQTGHFFDPLQPVVQGLPVYTEFRGGLLHVAGVIQVHGRGCDQVVTGLLQQPDDRRVEDRLSQGRPWPAGQEPVDAQLRPPGDRR